MQAESTDHGHTPTDTAPGGGCDVNVEAIRSLLEVPDQTLEEMVEEWSAARRRSLLATAVHQRPPEIEDLLSELIYGTSIVQKVISGRWCVVAELLRTGADSVTSWSLISKAIGMTELQAKDGFSTWVADQNKLRHVTGTIGLTDVEANTLHHLAEAASW